MAQELSARAGDLEGLVGRFRLKTPIPDRGGSGVRVLAPSHAEAAA
jgi:hypothetical protein